MLGVRRWDRVTGLFFFSFSGFLGGTFLGKEVLQPLCPAHPACSPYTGHIEAAGCGPAMEHNEQ